MFIVNVMGGLGNQLFQFNFALYLKNKFPRSDVRLNLSWFKKYAVKYLLLQNEFKIKNHYKKCDFKIVNDKSQIEEIGENENVVFEGYWQDPKFFGDFSKIAENQIAPKLNEKNKAYLKKIKEAKNAVSVHIRRGDYDNHFLHGNIATKSYFLNAIAEIKNQITPPYILYFF